MLKRICTALVIILLSISMMGCWDRIELEERGFVIGVAIDAAEDDEAQSEQGENSDKPIGKQRFMVTFQFVIPGALSGSEKGGMSAKKGGISSEASFNISSEGDTMDTIIAELSTRTSRAPYFEHLQVIIISEELAKTEYGFANVMDYFLRNQDMRRSIKVLVAKGKASKVLDTRPPNEKLASMYIRSIAENKKTVRMLPVSRIGDLAEHLLRNESFAIQRIIGRKQEVEITGSAAFRGEANNLIGFLGEEETEGLNYITGDVKHGVIKIIVNDNLVVYDSNNIKRRIKAVVNKNNKIQFIIRIETEGTVGESFERLDFLNPDIIRELESKVGKEIERLMNDAINKVQKEYEKDIFSFGQYLKENHYDTWKQVRSNWETGDNYFAQSSIKIETKVEIRNAGINNKTEKRR